MKIRGHINRKIGLVWMHGTLCVVEMRKCRRTWIFSSLRLAMLGEIIEASQDRNPAVESFISNIEEEDAAYWDDAIDLQD